MTIEQLAFKETDRFNTWMRNTIQNVQYCSNEKMTEGYNRVYNNYLRLELSYGERRNKK
jgi:hypothetical protein